ncbi:YceD family protein [Hyphococcus sp.]|uniref:YceD family protein n=1 Tax=Hyphococcus sp. TaxID=2038636 RepID=UPI003CCC1034
MSDTRKPELSHEIDITALPRHGRSAQLRADENARLDIARRLGVIAVNKLEGDLNITASSAEILVAGALNASLTRECVASLEEMTEEISETFEVSFLRGGEYGFAAGGAADESAWDGETTPPEIHEGDVFDLGEFLVQQLALAMDPFPRKADATSLAEVYGGGGSVSPFAELGEKLKKSDQNQ